MKYDLSVFQEPRGVMRIFQFIFALCAMYTTVNYSVTVTVSEKGITPKPYTIEYPFSYGQFVCNGTNAKPVGISLDVSSDARFFVATSVLSILYCIFIAVVYAGLDEIYQTKPEVPLADFMLTTILAIFWLSGSAAWSNGASALKSVTDAGALSKSCLAATVFTTSFSSLNISLLLGYLNFFLWASDLWFLYKETYWFKERQPTNEDGAGGSNMNAPNI